MKFSIASDKDAKAIAAVRTVAADKLTSDFGKGHWSSGGRSIEASLWCTLSG